MKALLIDDESLIRESLSLKLKLEDPSIDVRSCGTLEEARKEINDNEPDLIFLDVNMSESNQAGLDFLDELKDINFAGRVVMLSSEKSSATVGRAIGAGAVGFISKNDREPSAMHRAINLLLQGGVYISEELRRAPKFPRGSSSGFEENISIREVGPDEMKISAPRAYEALWHISNGAPYKTVATRMNIALCTAEEHARTGFNSIGAKSKTDFLVMLTKKGWKLRAPRSDKTKVY